MTGDGSLLEEWTWRGLVQQVTATDLESALAAGRVTAYIGFDPTAPSLHVGSLLPLLALVRFQRAGHRPIALVGGGTGLIGDPSGKDDERQLLDVERLRDNAAALRRQLERFLDFSGPEGALMIDNLEWLGELRLIPFLRDVGKHFSVNAMIARESIKRRLTTREHGISYTEFSYNLLQAYDFLELYDRHGCTLQMGGSDQWGNIVAGADLIRRERGVEAHGLTLPLITRSDGKKFGKSEEGNVWLDAEQTTPFELFQFWYNTPDADAVAYLKFFTFLDRSEIEELASATESRPEERRAQTALAREVTRIVHGEDALGRVERVRSILFGGGDLRELDADGVRGAFRSTPRSAVRRAELGGGGLPLLEALVRTGLAASKGRARHDVSAGAISVNHLPEGDVHRQLTTDDLIAGAYVVLRRGKKTYHLLRVDEA